MISVIGLSAKMGCGKTTLGDMMLERINGERVAFGDLLKHECAEYFGFPVELCYSQEGKETPIRVTNWPIPWGRAIKSVTVRKLLQWYGTDYRRKQDPEYWTHAMRMKLERISMHHVDDDYTVLIDDVRFPNEAQVCIDYGVVYRLEPFDGWTAGEHAGHVSETALDDYQHFTAVFKPEFGKLGDVADTILRMREMGKEGA